MKGYWNMPEATAEVIDAEGWFHTGDIGEVDADGFLRITDRKKELIVNAYGKNIAPAPIENSLKASRYIGQAVVIGDRRKFLAALLVPDFEALSAWAGRQGIADGDMPRRRPGQDPQVRALIDQEVAAVNKGLARYEQIVAWELLPDEFTLETGELTPTQKVKRRVINQKYGEAIDASTRGRTRAAGRARQANEQLPARRRHGPPGDARPSTPPAGRPTSSRAPSSTSWRRSSTSWRGATTSAAWSCSPARRAPSSPAPTSRRSPGSPTPWRPRPARAWASALFAAWEALPFPTVAAIRGTCLGGGTELALASTYRVVSDRRELRIGLPEMRLGILPGWGGSTRLPRLDRHRRGARPDPHRQDGLRPPGPQARASPTPCCPTPASSTSCATSPCERRDRAAARGRQGRLQGAAARAQPARPQDPLRPGAQEDPGADPRPLPGAAARHRGGARRHRGRPAGRLRRRGAGGGRARRLAHLEEPGPRLPPHRGGQEGTGPARRPAIAARGPPRGGPRRGRDGRRHRAAHRRRGRRAGAHEGHRRRGAGERHGARRAALRAAPAPPADRAAGAASGGWPCSSPPSTTRASSGSTW